ncbi:MAG: hypothetical protein AAGU74_12760 [Bacillota bacterium]
MCNHTKECNHKPDEAKLFTGGLTLEAGALYVINAAVVSLASNGAYDAVQRVQKKRIDNKMNDKTPPNGGAANEFII